MVLCRLLLSAAAAAAVDLEREYDVSYVPGIHTWCNSTRYGTTV